MQLQVIHHPLLARLVFVRGCNQQCANRFTPSQTQQHSVLTAPCNHGRCARACGTLGCQNFGQHPALADAGARTTRHGFQFHVTRLRFVHKLCVWITARIGRVEPFLIGQDNQRISIHQVRNKCTQSVVVTKLDFIVDHGVVFVDDRHYTQLQQGQQRRARIEITLPIRQVSVRQQHLSAANVVGTQLGFIHLHQTHLANRCCGLQFMDFFGPCRPAQTLHALCDSSAGDHDHFTADAIITMHKGCQLARPLFNSPFIEATPLIGHQTGADLDDDAARILQNTGRHD